MLLLGKGSHISQQKPALLHVVAALRVQRSCMQCSGPSPSEVVTLHTAESTRAKNLAESHIQQQSHNPYPPVSLSQF